MILRKRKCKRCHEWFDNYVWQRGYSHLCKPCRTILNKKKYITNCPHTDRKHKSKGMCSYCYQIQWKKKHGMI